MTTKCHYKIHVPRGDGTIVPITFQKIPACPQGFRMGSRYGQPNERPVHRVCISYDFWLSTTPITQQQFACWTRTDAYEEWLRRLYEQRHDNYHEHSASRPAEQVNYRHAIGFCDWMNQWISEGDMLLTRLPYEAEWEYACNAGEESAYHNGDGESALQQAGWYRGNSSQVTHEIAEKLPNRFDLYDVHGNVWEWCQDFWDGHAYRRRWDGITPIETYHLSEKYGSKTIRVVRGGSWFSVGMNCRSCHRDRRSANDVLNFNGVSLGLRVCLAPSADQSKSSDA